MSKDIEIENLKKKVEMLTSMVSTLAQENAKLKSAVPAEKISSLAIDSEQERRERGEFIRSITHPAKTEQEKEAEAAAELRSAYRRLRSIEVIH